MDDLQAIVRYYEGSKEEDRLIRGLGALELVRTREVLRRHLPPVPARIVDVGGGTGVHAEWLLDDGHDVHLVDLSPRNVDLAHRRLGASGLTTAVGDARHLELPDASADVVLVLGPLYHLVARHDRLAVLTEARRVVRPGGVVAAAAISRFASLFDGLAREFMFDSAFASIVRRDLVDGRHLNPDEQPSWFTTAYFHRPDELRDEVGLADLDVVDLVGLEGLASWLPHLEARWADVDDRNTILDAARLVETEPSVLGLSAHLLAVALRPTSTS